MKKITFTTIIQFLKNIQLIDWIIILVALFCFYLGFLLNGPFPIRIPCIVGPIAMLLTLVKNRKYKLIGSFFCWAIFVYWYCYTQGWI